MHKFIPNKKEKGVIIMTPDLKLLTPSARQIIITSTGYRCEEQSTGYHNAQDILDYEINELGNNDIPDTLKRIYHYEYQDINHTLSWIKQQLKTDAIDLIWLAANWQSTIEFYSDDHKSINKLSQAIDSNNNPIPIDKYTLPNHNAYLLISDCDVDGQLFAYPQDMPLTVTTIN